MRRGTSLLGMAGMLILFGGLTSLGCHRGNPAQEIARLLATNATDMVVLSRAAADPIHPPAGRVHINFRYEASGDVVRIVMDRWVDSSRNTLEVYELPADAIDPAGIEVKLDRPATMIPWDQVPPEARSDRHRIVLNARPGRFFQKTVEQRSGNWKTNEERFRQSGGGRESTVDRVTLWAGDGEKAQAIADGIRAALR